MKQTTAKTVEQALAWIESHAHHIVSIYPLTCKPGEEKGIELIGNQEKLRVPDKLRLAVWRKLRPNPRAFDTRMYALTKHGREWLAKTRKDRLNIDIREPGDESISGLHGEPKVAVVLHGEEVPAQTQTIFQSLMNRQKPTADGS